MDNGQKSKEINVYAKHLVKGSILITHDWGVEINLLLIMKTLSKYQFQPLYHEVGVMLNSQVRAWIKTE